MATGAGRADRFARAVLARPRWALAGVAIALVAAGAALPGLGVDASVERLTRRDDPGWRALRRASEVFGSDDVVVIAQIGDGPAVEPERLEQLRRVGEDVAAVPGVASVWSLAETGHVRASPGGLEIADLGRRLPSDPGEFERLRESVESSPLHRRHLLSEDGKSAAIVVFPEDRPADPMLRAEVTAGVRAAMAAHAEPGLRLVASGNPTFTVDVAETLANDQARFTALSMAILALALAAFFRSVWAVVLPLAAVGLASLWTLGALALTGRSLSALTTVVPSLLLAVGVTYAIHVLHRHRDARGTAPERAHRALAGVAPATLLSTVTTMAGFAALSANRIDAIREFGAVAAAAVAFACVAVLALLPLGLARVGGRLPPPPEKGPLARSLAGLERAALGRGTAVLTAGAVLAGIAALAALRLEPDTAYVDYLRADHPANVDRREVLTHLAGPIPVRVVLDAGTPGAALKADVLARIAAFQRRAEALPGVHASYSLVDLLADMNRAWHAGEPEPAAWRRPPDSAALAEQYLLLYESSRFGADLERLVSFDRDRLVVWLRTELYRSREAAATLGALEAMLAETLSDLRPEVSGTLVTLLRSSDEISLGQTRSLLLALAAIGIVVMGAFRSLRLGLVAAVPNLLPVLLLFGAMGAAGIPLNVGTCVVACLCLGVAADDTIHFMLAWRDARRAGADPPTAVREAFARVGRPILETSLVLAAGFSVLGLSSFQPIAHLGALASLTMAACVVGDLLLLPALLARTTAESAATPSEPASSLPDVG